MLDKFFEVGQTFSLFLVLFFLEAVISAKHKSFWPGLLFAFAMIGLSVAIGLYFGEFMYFVYMLVPTAFCFLAFFISRRNIAKGNVFRDEILEEEEKEA